MNYSPNDTRLVMPSEIYARSYQAAIAEGLPVDPNAPPADMASFAAHVTWLNAPNAEVKLPNGRRALRVPQIEAWLTYAYTFIGRVDIRMRLTPELEIWGGHVDVAIRPSLQGRGFGTHLFGLALEKARNAGLRRILLTCFEADAAAVRMFARQGAVMQDRVAHPTRPDTVVQRYILEG